MTATDPSDVVITGVGVVSSLGIGRQAFWPALLAGDCGLRRLPGRLGDLQVGGVGGALLDFDAKQFVRPRKALKVMCREIQTAFASAMLAREEAGLDPDALPPERVGTVFGSEMMSGEPLELYDAMEACGVREQSPRVADFGEAAMRKMYPLWMLKYLPNMAACHVGISVGALGPNNTLISGDNSGVAALIEANSVVRRGIVDCVFTGAAGTRISASRLLFHGGLYPAPTREPYREMALPMGRDRCGVVNGEGAATLVLERRRIAAMRGAEVRARVAGTASRCVSPARSGGDRGVAIRVAIEAALSEAHLSPNSIGVVVSHAMGHPQLDRQEADAITAIFGDQLPVFAPIGGIGHTGAAAGSLGLGVATLILEHRMVPPTVNAERRDPDCRVRLLTEAEPLQQPHALVISHSHLGHATVAVLSSE